MSNSDIPSCHMLYSNKSLMFHTLVCWNQPPPPHLFFLPPPTLVQKQDLVIQLICSHQKETSGLKGRRRCNSHQLQIMENYHKIVACVILFCHFCTYRHENKIRWCSPSESLVIVSMNAKLYIQNVISFPQSIVLCRHKNKTQPTYTYLTYPSILMRNIWKRC